MPVFNRRYVRSPVDIAKPISKRRTDLSASLDESQRQLKLALRSLWRVLFISEFSEHPDLFLDSLRKDYQGKADLKHADLKTPGTDLETLAHLFDTSCAFLCTDKREFPLALKQKFFIRLSNSFRGYLLI